jgi:PPM family protein phosphatase
MKNEKKKHFIYAAGTHAGMKGKNNEDNYSVFFLNSETNQEDKTIVAIIADGIGGHLAGEVASKIAVDSISDDIIKSDGQFPQEVMSKSFLKTNDEIIKNTETDESTKGMGTTCVVAWIVENRLYLNSIGNSRAYLLRKKQFFQLNTDHTWVQEAVDAGTLTPSQARKHPHSNVIRRYLGSSKPFDSDVLIRGGAQYAAKNYPKGFKLIYGDRLLLCSDGLNDMVIDEQIEKIVRFNQVDDAIPLLIDKANKNGGKDNITVVLIEKPALWYSQLIPNFNLQNPNFQAIVGIAIILAMVIGAFIIYLWQLFSSA